MYTQLSLVQSTSSSIQNYFEKQVPGAISITAAAHLYCAWESFHISWLSKVTPAIEISLQ